MAEPVRLVGPLDRMLVLGTVPALSGLPRRQLAAVAQAAGERWFRTGEPLLRTGEPPEACYLVVEGQVRITRPGADRSLGPGQMIGMTSLLARSSAGAEATAERDTLTLEFGADLVLDLFEDDFALVQEQIRHLARRTLEARRRIAAGTHLAPWPAPLADSGQDLDLVERLVVLRRAAPFRRTSITALAHIARALTQHSHAPGAVLWKPGDPSGYQLVIVAGEVACTTTDQRTFTCGAGHPLGNLESLSGEPHWFEAAARSSLTVLRGDVDTLFDVMEDHFEMAMDLIAAMAGYLLQLHVDVT